MVSGHKALYQAGKTLIKPTNWISSQARVIIRQFLIYNAVSFQNNFEKEHITNIVSLRLRHLHIFIFVNTGI